MNKCYITFTDDNNNNYGILKVVSGYNEKFVKHLITEYIKVYESEERFFEDFSSNLSWVMSKLNSTIKNDFGDEAYIEFEYENTNYFNVDRVFVKDDFDRYVSNVKYTDEDIIEVVNNIINMLDNNIEYGTDYIGERFENWCEGGSVFDMIENTTDTEKMARKQIMEYLKDSVNDLTNKIYKLFDEKN